MYDYFRATVPFLDAEFIIGEIFLGRHKTNKAYLLAVNILVKVILNRVVVER